MKFVKTLKENKGFFLTLAAIITIKSSIFDWNYVPTGSMRPTLADGDQIFINKMAYDVTIPLTYISLHKIADPQRGDIVVFDTEKQQHRMVKRVLGVPGDVFKMRHDKLYINGEVAEYQENYTNEEIETTFAKLDEYDKERYKEEGLTYEKMGVEYRWEKLGSVNHAIRLESGVQKIDSLGVQEFTVPEDMYFMVGDNRNNSFDSRYWGLIKRDEVVGKVNYVVFSLDQGNYLKPRIERFLKYVE